MSDQLHDLSLPGDDAFRWTPGRPGDGAGATAPAEPAPAGPVYSLDGEDGGSALSSIELLERLARRSAFTPPVAPTFEAPAGPVLETAPTVEPAIDPVRSLGSAPAPVAAPASAPEPVADPAPSPTLDFAPPVSDPSAFTRPTFDLDAPEILSAPITPEPEEPLLSWSSPIDVDLSALPAPSRRSSFTPPAADSDAPAAPAAFQVPPAGTPFGGAADLGGPLAAPAPTGAPIHAPAPIQAPGSGILEAPSVHAPTLASGRGPATSSILTIQLTEHAREHADPELIDALSQVVIQGASDLHVTTESLPSVRVDGALRPAVIGEPWDRGRVRQALESIMTEEQQAKFAEVLELDFAYSLSTASRFRVNVYQQRGSWGAAFRLIPTEIKQLSELGVPDSVARFAGLPRGLVLVTGPTGSGKSTTLAALIDLVNETRSDHIVTVEDPIEFMHKHKRSLVNQREVGGDTHSFAAALKHVLRQDPDVILIGELRDLETISVALTAAETGHLVFATLHTQDAPQTIDRVIDVFPHEAQGQVRAQLAGTLQGVVSQTLVKKASGRGRVVATEILVMTPAVGNLIREGKTYQITSAMQAGRDLGMHTMDQNLADLVNTGRVTMRDALEKVHDPDGFGRLVQRVESPTEASARAIANSGIDFGDAFSGGDH